MGTLGLTAITTAWLLTAGCVAQAGDTNEATGQSSAELGDLTPQVPQLPPVQIIHRCGLNFFLQSSSVFHFDNGTAQGFTLSGLFDGDSSTVTSSVAMNPAFWMDRTDFPNAVTQDPVDNNGSIVLPGGSPMYARTTSGWWRADFTSPVLGGGWQNKTDFRYQVLEQMSLTQLYAQFVVEVVKCDGSTSFFREVNAAGQPVFCALTHGQWTQCTTHVTFNNVDYIKRVHVDIFGETAGIYEGGTYIDDVQAL
jgi:hypothetical protein